VRLHRTFAILVLVTLLLLYPLPFLATLTFAQKESADEVWVLHERGADYEIYYDQNNPEIRKWTNAPSWVMDYSTGKYVPYIFVDKFDSEGYFQVQSATIGARIYSGYATFYDPQLSEVRVYQEQWEVQQLAKNGKWSAVAGTYSPFEGSNVEESDMAINVTMKYSSWAGQLNVTYTFREGRPLKHTVTFKSLLDNETVFRVVQLWSGIQASKARNERNVVASDNAYLNGTLFEFTDENDEMAVIESQRSAVEFFDGASIEKSANGMKASFTFSNWTLSTGGLLQVDPDTQTYTPSTTHKAYYGTATDTIDPSDATTEFTGDMYTKAQTSDDDRALTQKAGTGDLWTAHRFTFDWTAIGITVTAISSLTINIEGYGYCAGTSNSYYYVYIKESSSWNLKQNYGQVYSEQNYTKTYTSGFSNLIVSDSLQVGQVAWGTHAGGSTTYLYTDLVKITVVYTYNAPVLTSATISSLDDGDNVYAMKYYSFLVTATDAEGADDISCVYLRATNSSGNVIFEVHATDLNSTASYSIHSNSTEIDLDTASCSWAEDGNTGTVTFRIRAEWDIQQYEDLNLVAYVQDSEGYSDGWETLQANYFDVITRLTVTSLQSNATLIRKGADIQISGNVRYATSPTGNTSSSVSPPDAQFTAVHIHNSTHDSQGSDTTVTDGAFAVSFTVPSTDGIYVYHVYLDMEGDYTDADAPDGDTVTVTVADYVLALTFENETGATAYDYTSYNNDGTLSAGVTRTDSGYFGRAITFSGSDTITVSDSASLDVSSTVTVGAWVKTSSTSSQTILEKSGAYELYILPDFAIRATVGTDSLDTSTGQFSADTWTHIAMTYNGSYISIYVNGVEVASTPRTGSIPTNANDLIIGDGFDGTIDEVMVLSTATTAMSALMSTSLYSYPYVLSAEIDGMVADDWILILDSYTFNATLVQENSSTPLTYAYFAFADGSTTYYAIYNDTSGTWTLTSNYLQTADRDWTETGNAVNFLWEIYFTSYVTDAQDCDLLVYCEDEDGNSDSYTLTDYFNIYSSGGLTELSSSGDGGRISGGGMFDVAATNGTAGSWARVNATWANFQHMHTTVHWWIGTDWDGSGEYWDCVEEHNNTGYVEYGVDYWHDGGWVEGWKVHIEIDDGAAGIYGGNDASYVILNVSWYNRGTYIKSDQIAAFFESYTSSDVETQFTLYIDLWVSSAEAGGMGAGHVSSMYYGMEKGGWWLWASWSPIGGLATESTFSDYLKDASNNYIKASSLKMFKVWTKVAKTSADGGSPNCDSHMFATINPILQWRTLPPQQTLTGVDTPQFNPTTTPDTPVGFFQSLVNGIVGVLIQIRDAIIGAGEVLSFMVAAIIDSAFSFFGIENFSSTMWEFLETLVRFFATSISYILSVTEIIFTTLAALATLILSTLSSILETLFNIAEIVVGIIEGTGDITTEFGNLLDLMNLDEWSTVIPLLMIVWWFASIDERGKRTGNWVGVFWGDVQTIIAIISFILDSAWRLLNTFIDLVFRFISALPIT